MIHTHQLHEVNYTPKWRDKTIEGEFPVVIVL